MYHDWKTIMEMGPYNMTYVFMCIIWVLCSMQQDLNQVLDLW